MFFRFNKKKKIKEENEEILDDLESSSGISEELNNEDNSKNPIDENLSSEMESNKKNEMQETESLEDQKESDDDKEDSKPSLFQRLKNSLASTRKKLAGQIRNLFTIGKKIDQNTLDELEEILISSDMGFECAESIKEAIKEAYRHKEVETDDEISNFIKSHIKKMLHDEGLVKTGVPIQKINMSGPTVIMVIGVNGSGKTTSIAKLTNHIKSQGHTVMLAAADTFRAAAVEQLTIWSERENVPIIRPNQEGVDPASVVYDASVAAKNENIDFLIIDTAGRLHTQKDLMNQLEKMHRVISKNIDGAPHETILILDSTTGQNALVQGREFGKVHDITGLILTKLDGSAKGGVVINMCRELKIPVRYIGIGEQVGDFEIFDTDKFVDAVFE